MMVICASAGPRVWSVSVIGGKMDGVSGPGVGAAANDVHAACAGISKVGARVGVGTIEVGEVPQAVRIERRKMKET